MDRKEIGIRIKTLREEKGWTKGTLATRAGVSPSYIPVLESGEKCPTVETLDAICFALGITLAEFFAEKTNNLSANKLEKLTETQKQLLNAFLNSLQN